MVDGATCIPIDEARAETPFSATLGTEANEAVRVKLTATPEGLVAEIGFVGADLPEFARSSEGRERLRVFLDGGTRATWRDHQRMLCGIHHTPQAKPKPVKRGPKIAARDVVTAAAQAFARNEIDRAELMRRITPSLSR
jgi:hypothetical protein